MAFGHVHAKLLFSNFPRMQALGFSRIVPGKTPPPPEGLVLLLGIAAVYSAVSGVKLRFAFELKLKSEWRLS